jgi:hypothetical protein
MFFISSLILNEPKLIDIMIKRLEQLSYVNLIFSDLYNIQTVTNYFLVQEKIIDTFSIKILREYIVFSYDYPVSTFINRTKF